LKELILRKLPQISFKKYCMKVGHKELGDDTASLRQLLIQNGDQIKLEKILESASVERRAPRSSQLHHSLAMSSLDPTRRESEMLSQQYSSSAIKMFRSPLSMSEIVENEEHIRHEAANSRPTHAMLRGRLRDMSGEELKAKAEMSKEYSNTAKGKRLWETATRAAPLRNHVRLEELDKSSTTNCSHELSLKERYAPSSSLFKRYKIQEQSVLMESDDSYDDSR
jgi:hypothetical protein